MLQGHEETVWAVAVHQDTGDVFSGGGDWHVRHWPAQLLSGAS